MARFSLLVICSTDATCQGSLLPTNVRTVAQSRVIDDYWLPSGHKKTSRPLGWEVNRHQRRALSRGTSPANLDGDAALSAHAVSKARASARCRAWLRPPNRRPRASAAATAGRLSPCVRDEAGAASIVSS